VEAKFRTALDESLKLRHFADYETDLTYAISTEAAEATLREANEFVTMAEKFLEGAGGNIE
jgi:hypothetical protein